MNGGWIEFAFAFVRMIPNIKPNHTPFGAGLIGVYIGFTLGLKGFCVILFLNDCRR